MSISRGVAKGRAMGPWPTLEGTHYFSFIFRYLFILLNWAILKNGGSNQVSFSVLEEGHLGSSENFGPCGSPFFSKILFDVLKGSF